LLPFINHETGVRCQWSGRKTLFNYFDAETGVQVSGFNCPSGKLSPSFLTTDT
jgi:hypothetical protein